jgi:hypothetical protein
VVGVVDVGTRDCIALSDLRLKIGAVISAAGFCGVGLPYFVLADWFEDQIAILSRDILLVQERCKRLIQAKQDVDVAVRFLADLFDGAGYRKALGQNVEAAGIVDVLPESLIALSSGYL